MTNTHRENDASDAPKTMPTWLVSAVSIVIAAVWFLAGELDGAWRASHTTPSSSGYERHVTVSWVQSEDIPSHTDVICEDSRIRYEPMPAKDVSSCAPTSPIDVRNGRIGPMQLSTSGLPFGTSAADDAAPKDAK